MAAGENVYRFGPNVQKWIDPLGLCKGKATIRHYEPEPNRPHFTVEVQQGKNRFVTEQYGVPGTDTGIAAGDSLAAEGLTPKSLYEFELPDAKAAMDYQKQLIQATNLRNAKGISGPLYDVETKSCLTHCFDVVQTGGVENVPATSKNTLSLHKFMKKFEVK
jgi:hypothetical protein